MFRYVHFQLLVDLKTRFLEIVHAAYPNNIGNILCLDVYYRVVMF